MSNSLKYKIIGDSCLDLTEELKRDPHFQMIPLTLQVDDVQIVDDETFDQKRFLELVKKIYTFAPSWKEIIPRLLMSIYF